MLVFESPSFSLGLDFDLDSQPQTTARNDPQARPSSANPSFRLIEDDDDFETPTMVSGASSDPQAPPARACIGIRAGGSEAEVGGIAL
ncbi:hypothetical protein Acr_23g0008750 [Actinidia rufa]|uniref:Uncharacterized protein n=1 Tax=Actinidia rufa TaxID=165716 RepID=A0A7J0GNW1_9ERIC|nr:hypothetical protein Acr_23g0008750 [Actinidia rufa]